MDFFSKKGVRPICLPATLTGITWGQAASLTSDSLAVSHKAAEHIFLTNNCLLPIPINNSTIADAGIKQVHVWTNLTLFVQRNFYTPRCTETDYRTAKQESEQARLT